MAMRLRDICCHCDGVVELLVIDLACTNGSPNCLIVLRDVIAPGMRGEGLNKMNLCALVQVNEISRRCSKQMMTSKEPRTNLVDPRITNQKRAN